MKPYTIEVSAQRNGWTAPHRVRTYAIPKEAKHLLSEHIGVIFEERGFVGAYIYDGKENRVGHISKLDGVVWYS